MFTARGGRTLAQHPDALTAVGYAFEERAAIHEHDGGLPRVEAERPMKRLVGWGRSSIRVNWVVSE